MATSTTDIKNAGGKCEYVATDFWECTDKDGKKWWCSDGGKTCIPKPLTWHPGRDEIFHSSIDIYLFQDDSGHQIVTTPIGVTRARIGTDSLRTDELNKRNEQTSRALRWVQDTPGVQAAAAKAAKGPRATLPDSLIANPGALVAAAAAAVRAAKEQGASDEIVASLEQVTSRYKAGAARLDDDLQYSARAFGDLVGMRDRSELEGPLLAALAKAPDDANREKLTQVVALIRRPPSFHVGFPLDGNLEVSCDWLCCAFVCVLCEVGCVACCAAACLLC